MLPIFIYLLAVVKFHLSGRIPYFKFLYRAMLAAGDIHMNDMNYSIYNIIAHNYLH